MFRRVSLWILIAVSPLPAAVSREMQELQRDVAQLQDLVKTLNTTVNDKLTALDKRVQGTSDAAAEANAAVAALGRNIEKMQREQETKLAAPVSTMGTRIDKLSGGLDTVQQGVSDLAATLAKLQTQIGDLANAVKVMQAPVVAPPADKPLPAGELMENAERDRTSGKFELAVPEYQEFLKLYSDAPPAADAQYYLGWIHFAQRDYQNALQDYDAVLKNYPKSTRVPDALLLRGKTLVELGRDADASATFRDLRRRFPNSDPAKQSLSIKVTAGKP